MLNDLFLTQIDDILEFSVNNFIAPNSFFFASLLFENITNKHSHETLAKYYLQEKMFTQVVNLIKTPKNEIESFYLACALFHLQKYDQAIEALFLLSKKDKLKNFLADKTSEQEEISINPDLKNKTSPREKSSFQDKLENSEKLRSQDKNITSAKGPKCFKSTENVSFEENNLILKHFQTQKRVKSPIDQKSKKAKKIDYKNEEFCSNCVANGPSGFFYLGLIFECQSKLELSAMCFRNCYRLDSRIFSAYVKFVEITAKIEFDNSFNLGIPETTFSINHKNLKNSIRKSFKTKSISSSKMMTYLLQKNTSDGLLEKRSTFNESIDHNLKNVSPKKNLKKLKQPDFETFDETMMTFPMINQSANITASDMYSLNSATKKENKNLSIQAKINNLEMGSNFDFRAISRISGNNNTINSTTDENMLIRTSNQTFTSQKNEIKEMPKFDMNSYIVEKQITFFQKENKYQSNEQISNPACVKFDSSQINHSLSNSIAKKPRKKTKQQTENNFEIFSFLKTLKKGLIHYFFNEFQEAIDFFKPYNDREFMFSHHKCSFALIKTARSCMNIMKYEEANKLFEMAFMINPHTTEGFEFYSSCLWYTKSMVKLVDLTQVCEKNFTNSSINKIIRGNCYSLAKNNENAISSFKEALKLDPKNSYCFCLLGHEYVIIENFKLAKECYLQALELDRQQFHAYWGLGNIYLQIDDFGTALICFYNSLAVNPHCSLLHSYIGIAYLNLNQNKKALDNLKKAELIQGFSPMNTYYKAVAHFKLNEYELAAGELLILLDKVKVESKIYVLLGKVYKKLGKINESHECFTKAINLDPRDSQGKIRELFEMINSSDQEDISSNLLRTPGEFK